MRSSRSVPRRDAVSAVCFAVVCVVSAIAVGVPVGAAGTLDTGGTAASASAAVEDQPAALAFGLSDVTGVRRTSSLTTVTTVATQEPEFESLSLTLQEVKNKPNITADWEFSGSVDTLYIQLYEDIDAGTKTSGNNNNYTVSNPASPGTVAYEIPTGQTAYDAEIGLAGPGGKITCVVDDMPQPPPSNTFTLSESDIACPDHLVAKSNATSYTGSWQTVTPDLQVGTGTYNSANVSITSGFDPGNDQLDVTTDYGLTKSYDSTTGVLTLAGSASETEYKEVLRTVEFKTTSTGPDTGNRTISFSLGKSSVNTAGVEFNPENGNFYEYVSSSDTDWSTANSTATTKTFAGASGYLATITDAQENAFLLNRLDGSGWIGATDNASAFTSASESQWYWATGPEQGTHILDGTGSHVDADSAYSSIPGAGSAVGSEFTNWGARNEPDNKLPFFGGENYGYFCAARSDCDGTPAGTWIDAIKNTPGFTPQGYIVEYTGKGNTADTDLLYDLSDTKTVTIDTGDGTAPVADASNTATSVSGGPPYDIPLDGSASTANGQSIATYEWDVNGNGSTDVTGATPTYTVEQPGTYTVELTVTDSAGDNATDTVSVTVDDGAAPTVRIYGDTLVTPGETIQFTGTNSTDDEAIDSFAWDFDTSDATATDTTAASPTHSYSSSGTYTVELQATDAAGNSDTTTETITVDGTAPTVDNPDPSDGADISNTSPSYTVDITDSLSGVDTSSITVSVSDSSGSVLSSVGTGHSDVSYSSGTLTISGPTYAEGQVDVTVDVDDQIGNSASTFTSSFRVDTTAPTVNSITRSSPTGADTNADSVTFSVAFSETVESISTGDFTLNTGGSVSASISSVGSSSGSSVTVTVDSITGDDSLGLDIGTTDITDLAGKDLDTTEPSTDETYALDNTSPTFSAGGSTSDSMAEGTTGTVLDVEADDDTGSSYDTDVTYSLGGTDPGPFSIDTSTGQLSLDSAQDFENPGDGDTNNDYELTVTATDDVGNTDQQSVTVSITDVNEAPAAPSDSDGASDAVAETASNGDAVGIDADASDPDGDALTWSLTDDASGRFTIDSTGVVTVADATKLDHESSASHTITVQASDGSLSATTDFTISVTDADETPTVTSGTSDSIGEDATNGDTVHDVNANVGGSADAGVDYSITSGNGDGAYSIDSSTGVITVADASQLDHEASASRTVTVQASEGTASTDQTVDISVDDVDETPSFSSVTSDTVAEDAANGDPVHDANAGVGGGSDSGVSYSITSGNSAGAFSIDSATGQIDVADKSQFDYEGTNSFSLDIQAAEGTATTTQTVSISITDVDETPSFAGVGSQTVRESDSAGTNVVDIEADVIADGSSPTDTGVSYAITAGNTDVAGDGGGAFAIDSSGQVTINDADDIDKSQQSSFTLTVEASEGGQAATQDVSISVTDDVSPTLSSSDPTDGETGHPPAEDLTLTFSEDVSLGTGDITVVDDGDGSSTEALDVTTSAVSVSGDTVTLDPTSDLEAGTDYHVEIASTAVDDTNGNSFAGFTDSTTLDFTTANTDPTFTAGGTATPSVTEDGTLDLASTLEVADISSSDTLTWTVTSAPTDGTLSGVDSESVSVSGSNSPHQLDTSPTYTPDPDFDGSDSFDVQVADTNPGTTDTITVDVSITAVDDAPTAPDDSSQSTGEDSTATVSDGASTDLLVLASDPDTGDTLSMDQVDGSSFAAGSPVTLGSGASVTVDSDGSWSYDPSGQFDSLTSGQSTTDSFTYTVADDDGDTAQGTVTVTITGRNDAPTLSTDDRSLDSIDEDDTDNGGTTVSTILGSAGSTGDAEGATLGVAVTGVDDTDGTWEYSTDGGGSWSTVSSAAPADSSALLLASDDHLRFVPNADFSGTAGGSVTLRAWDGTSGGAGDTGADASTTGGTTAYSTATASAGITVDPVNDAPTDLSLTSTSVGQSGGTDAVVGSLSATDVDDASHTFALVSGTGDGDNGEFDINSGDLRADDASTLAAGSYSVRLEAADGNGGTYQESVSITVVDDVAPTLSSSDPADDSTGHLPGDSLTLTFSEDIDFGTGDVTLRENSGGFTTAETFDVTSDTGGGDGTVSISGSELTITPTSDLAPGTEYAVRIDGTAIEDDASTPNSYAGINNDDDLDFTTADTAPSLTQASGGTISVSVREDGTVDLTSDLEVKDISSSDTLTWTVTSAPTDGTVSDLDGESVTFSSGSTHTLDSAPTYAPDADFASSGGTDDSFDVQVTDGDSNTATATVEVDVTPVNDAPAISLGSDQTVGGTTSQQTVTDFATGFDPGGGSDESSQHVQDFTVTTSDPVLDSVDITDGDNDDKGDLTYTAASDAEGTATVSVTVTDDGGTGNGGTDTSAAKTFDITVDTQAPTVDSASVSESTLTVSMDEGLAGTNTPAGSDFTVTAGGSTIPVSGVINDGSSLTLSLESNPAAGDTVTLDYTQGTEVPEDSATNKLAGFTGQSVTNNVADTSGGTTDTTPPTAETGPDRTRTVGEEITFDASNSTDNEGITSYDWTFPDGDGTGVTTTHTFESAGEYTVELTVADDEGNTDTDTVTITVEAQTEGETGGETVEAVLSADSRFISLGTNVTFTTDESTGDRYELDFDDGTTATGEQVSHEFTTLGTHTVTLTVTADGGSATDTVNVSVSDETPPTVELAGPTTTPPATPVTFDASNSTDNVNITGYRWQLGDNTTAHGPTVTHTYTEPGSYPVSVTVRDQAGQTTTRSQQVTVTAPNASVPLTSHDFGRVGLNSTASTSLPITNTGTVPLGLGSASFDGDADQFSLAGNASGTVQPGATERLRVQYSPATAATHNATLRLPTNDTTISLPVSGTGVETGLSVNRSTVPFGPLSTGQSSTERLSVRNTRSSSLTVTARVAGRTPEAFAIEGSRNLTLGSGETGTLAVRAAPTTVGNRSATLQVGPEGTPVSVSLSTTGQGPNATLPERVEFGAVGKGRRTNRTVTLKNTGTAPLSITDTSITGPDATAFRVSETPTLAPGQSQSLPVWFAPETADDYDGRLTVTTNDTRGRYTVGLNGTGLGPRIGTSAWDLDYGNVTINTTRTLSVTIRNHPASPANLTISNTTVVGQNPEAFSVVEGAAGGAAGSYTLAPGERRQVAVRIEPRTPGPKKAQLRVFSDARNEPQLDVWLSNQETVIIVRERDRRITTQSESRTVLVDASNVDQQEDLSLNVSKPGTRQQAASVDALNMTVEPGGDFEMNLTHATDGATVGAEPYDPPGNRSVIQHIELTHSIPNSELNDTGLSYRVAKSELDDAVPPDTVTFRRYADGTWNEHAGQLRRETRTHYIYSVDTPGFSQFLVTAPTTENITSRDTNESTAPETATPGDDPATPAPSRGTPTPSGGTPTPSRGTPASQSADGSGPLVVVVLTSLPLVVWWWRRDENA